MLIPGKPMALKPYPPSVRCDKNVPKSYQAKKTFDTRGRKCRCKALLLAIRWRLVHSLLVFLLSVFNFWGMLWECTLRSYRVLRFYQHETYNYNTCCLYKFMPLLYSLSRYIWIVVVIRCTSCIVLSCCEDLFQGFCQDCIHRITENSPFYGWPVLVIIG